MKTTLIVNSFEAKGIREGRISLVVRRMKEQPRNTPMRVNDGRDLLSPSQWIRQIDGTYRWYYVVNQNIVQGGDEYIKAPYLPGQRVGLRETWADISKYVEVPRATVFLSNGPCFNIFDTSGKEIATEKDLKWRSAATLPFERIETFVTITEVRAVRVFDISDDEAMMTGVEFPRNHYRCDDLATPFRLSLHNYWLSRYPKSNWETDWAWAVGVRKCE